MRHITVCTGDITPCIVSQLVIGRAAGSLQTSGLVSVALCPPPLVCKWVLLLEHLYVVTFVVPDNFISLVVYMTWEHDMFVLQNCMYVQLCMLVRLEFDDQGT